MQLGSNEKCEGSIPSWGAYATIVYWIGQQAFNLFRGDRNPLVVLVGAPRQLRGVKCQ